MHNFHQVKQLNNTIQDSKNEGNQENYLETFKNGQRHRAWDKRVRPAQWHVTSCTLALRPVSFHSNDELTNLGKGEIDTM